MAGRVRSKQQTYQITNMMQTAGRGQGPPSPSARRDQDQTNSDNNTNDIDNQTKKV